MTTLASGRLPGTLGTLPPGTGSSPAFSGGLLASPAGKASAVNHLESIGRRWDLHPEEHRNLPPTGLPTATASTNSAATASAFSSSGVSLANSSSPLVGPPAGPGAHERISVPQLMEDGRLGLVVQNCWVASITDSRAAQWGWKVGDHILSVNGHAVTDMRQLSLEISRATASHQAVAHPIVFDVWRPAETAGSQEASTVSRRTKTSCWDCDCLSSGTPQPAPQPVAAQSQPYGNLGAAASPYSTMTSPGYGGYGAGSYGTGTVAVAPATAPAGPVTRRKALC